ncbi:MAG: metallophosphoesterase [Gemmatimonadota bacterium]|nr:MAG: metallophosphoesterase [Gemmatimonadota bacterium]
MRVSGKSLTTIGVAALAVPLLAAAASAVMFDCGPVLPAPQEDAGQAELRLDGEYGLWVRESGDSLEARWLTREAGAGYLEVIVDGGAVFEVETEPGTAHAASFSRPAAPELMLRYGGRGDPQDAHETVIYFDLQRRPIQTEFAGVDTLFIVGDVHGKYAELSELFRNAGLIDEDDRWTGGHKWIVLLGDLVDRGPDVHKTLWFLYELERDAARHGGRVQVLLGNHEIMAMTDDPRYVSAKEQLIAVTHGAAYWQLFDPRSSILGKWLAAKPALIRIDRVLLAHGGVGPEYMHYTIPEFDDSLATFMSEQWFSRMADTTAAYTPLDSVTLFRRLDFFFDDNSVFWYRDYVYSDTLGHMLQQVLERHDSDIHVVGHTPLESIQQMYDGALIAVDLEDAAIEMLLLVRSSASYQRFRYTLSGPPQPLEIAVPTGGG